MVPSFAILSPRYQELWSRLEPTPAKVEHLTTICNNLKFHQKTYEEASTAVWGKPDYWWFVAITDQMEGGGGANTYLGNGQPLHEKTTEVPVGHGPFHDFVAGAVDALKGMPAPTSVAQAAYNWEGFNGWGYLSKPIEDPYLASWSNQYTSGKYVEDHVFDSNAVSAQPGALTLLKVLMPKEDTVATSAPWPTPKPPSTPSITPPVISTTEGHVMVDATEIVKDVNIGLAMIEKLLPFLGFLVGPQVSAVLGAAIAGVRTIESTAGVPTDVAAAAVTSHLTPGAPNHPSLSG